MNYDFLNMLNCFCFNTVVFSLINIPTPEAKAGMVWQRNMLLNHSVFVKRKHNLLSPNGDNVLNITLYPYSAIKPFVRGKMHTVSAIFSAFPVF